MTDQELVSKKLAEVETYVRELRHLGRLERLETDVKEERFVCHTLQLALQAILDVASHIVSDERLGEPASLRDLFTILAKDGWLAPSAVHPLQEMASFRNLLVHEYARIDLTIVRDVVTHRLVDLEAFVEGVRRKLGPPA